VLSYHTMKRSLESQGHVVQTPEPRPKKKRNNEESVMQRSFIRWWQSNCRHFDVPEILLFSVPNGFNGDARRGSVMKLEGQRKGCPDLFLAVSRMAGYESSMTRYFGLFMELKRPAGIVSPEQEVFHQRLTEQGYAVHVVRSLQECINVTTTYLTR
jgi:hypothetical protein